VAQPQKRPGSRPRTQENQQGTRPRWGFIVLAAILFIIGTVLVFRSYSNDSGGLYFGLGLGVAGVLIGFFAPSRRDNTPPPNGNHGRA
jgi:hypothetical protein